jgi:hypothetical protein
LKGSQYDPLSLYHYQFSQQLRMSRNLTTSPCQQYLQGGTSIFPSIVTLVPEIH